MRYEPLAVKEFRLISQPRIGKQGHNGLAGSAFARKTHRAGQVDAGRQPQKQSFFPQQLVNDGQRRLILERPAVQSVAYMNCLLLIKATRRVAIKRLLIVLLTVFQCFKSLRRP